MDDLFISYKREERAKARLLADALESRGWSVWWDPKLRAGEHFDDVIEEAIRNVKCVIVLWSNRSITSRHVKDEASYMHLTNTVFAIQSRLGCHANILYNFSRNAALQQHFFQGGIRGRAAAAEGSRTPPAPGL